MTTPTRAERLATLPRWAAAELLQRDRETADLEWRLQDATDGLADAWDAGRNVRRDYRGDVLESNPYREVPWTPKT